MMLAPRMAGPVATFDGREDMATPFELSLRRPTPRVPLLWRILAGNALVLTTAVLVIAFTPASIPEPDSVRSALGVLAGVGVVLAVNMVLFRRALAPLRRLTEVMGRVDPLSPGERIPENGGDTEVVELTQAFNQMLERLEHERKDAASRTIAAQEAERLRIARELHDEIGQRLTAMLLQLSRLGSQAPAGLQAGVQEATETARGTLDEVRAIAAQLRPVALDDLGLLSALSVLAEQMSESGGPQVETRLAPALPPLGQDAELVIYRVAQEALTNAVRHAGASHVAVVLARDEGHLRLRVSDNGRGLDGAQPGNGVRGMRERALQVGARLAIRPRERGTDVELDLPVR
jgi:two-component system, NarL family, sensor histidine kinase UhpB